MADLKQCKHLGLQYRLMDYNNEVYCHDCKSFIHLTEAFNLLFQERRERAAEKVGVAIK